VSRVLITGSIAYDILLGYDGAFTDSVDSSSLDSLSVSFFSPHFEKHYGGTGANIAWNLALLDGDPLLVGSVGRDGGEYLSLLKDRGVDTKNVEQLHDHVTATAIINTDTKEHQIAFFHPGADMHGAWCAPVDDREDIAYAIVSPRDPRLMLTAMNWCAEYRVPVFFDPGQQVALLSEDDVSRAVRVSTGVIVNEYEWSLLKEKLHCTEENFAQLCSLLIVTRGEHGLTMFDENGALDIGVCPIDSVVNPTGAGDALRAGLLYGLSHNWSRVDSCRLGAVMGARCVECPSTQMQTIDRDSLWQTVEDVYGERLPEVVSVSVV
jgi:adenosine kinase